MRTPDMEMNAPTDRGIIAQMIRRLPKAERRAAKRLKLANEAISDFDEYHEHKPVYGFEARRGVRALFVAEARLAMRDFCRLTGWTYTSPLV